MLPQLWTPDEVTDSPIYLHYLNRELSRAVGRRLSTNDIIDLTISATILSRGVLLSSLALVWEASLLTGEGADVFSALLSGRHLRLISEFTDVGEFVSSSQQLYGHDRDRYPMYFGDELSANLAATPSIQKLEGTTSALTLDLEELLGAVSVDSIRTLPGTDLFDIVQGLPLIGQGLEHRDGRALTMTLFSSEVVADQVSPSVVPAIGRLLSKLHIEHYLQFAGADILTGLPHLAYLDTIAEYIPRYDVTYAWTILEAIGVNRSSLRPYARYLIDERGGADHLVFLSQLRLLLHAVHAIDMHSRRRHPTFGIDDRALRSRDSEADWKSMLISQSGPLHDHWPGEPVYPILSSRLAQLTTRLASSSDRVSSLLEGYRDMADDASSRTLILVANETEFHAVVDSMKEAGASDPIPQYLRFHTVFDLGIVGGTQVLLAESGQGTESPDAMTLTAVDISDQIVPDFVILVGIAYGLKKDEQTLGDVLVSTRLKVMDFKKVTQTGEIGRGDRATASVTLIDRFKGGLHDFVPAQVHFGLMLSLNTLVNSQVLRDQLSSLEPDAIGGEMEGAGVYCVSAKRKLDWIVVKGISDWGVGKTDKHRARAAANAARAVAHTIGKGGLAKRP